MIITIIIFIYLSWTILELKVYNNDILVIKNKKYCFCDMSFLHLLSWKYNKEKFIFMSLFLYLYPNTFMSSLFLSF
jgi:hypothetical protein